MKITQVFKLKADKKHSVLYTPAVDTNDAPAFATNVYISRLVLPRALPQITLTLEAIEDMATPTPRRLEGIG